jgi:hypothetical protein
MAEYRLLLQPPKGDFIYEEDMRTLHVTIDDIFARAVEFGSWCKDNILVTNADTDVSVLFRPWMDTGPEANRAMFQSVYNGKTLYLDVWIDKDTRDRAVKEGNINVTRPA